MDPISENKGLRVEIFSRPLRKNTTRPLTVWICGTVGDAQIETSLYKGLFTNSAKIIQMPLRIKQSESLQGSILKRVNCNTVSICLAVHLDWCSIPFDLIDSNIAALIYQNRCMKALKHDGFFPTS